MRTKLFISHATPHDNEFSIWLASRLTLAGYSIWLDRRALLGGEDFWDEIEQTIRHDAIKVLVAVTPVAVTRPGVKNEIALATATARANNLPNFLVPMRAGPIDWNDFPVEFIRVNGIDFNNNWGAGLVQLLEMLARDGVPKSPSVNAAALDHWRQCQTVKANTILQQPETLIANRIGIDTFPKTLRIYELKRPLREPGEMTRIAKQCPIPCFSFGRQLISFAQLDELQDALGPETPIRTRSEVDTEDFLSGEMQSPNIEERDAWNLMSSLIRKAINVQLKKRGLNSRPLANGELSWWFPEGLLDKDKLYFVDTDGRRTFRAVCGRQKNKKWYLGFTLKPSIGMSDYITLRPRVMVGDQDGVLLPDGKQMNNARKGVCKNWFNNRWRAQTVGFVDWLKQKSESPMIPVSETEAIVLSAQLMEFESPVAIILGDTPISDDDEAQERQSDPGFKPINDNDDED